MVVGSGLAQLTTVLWKPFESRFCVFQEELKSKSGEVREEIALTLERAAHRERQLQVIERNVSSQYRIRADAHRHEEREWRLQMNERKLGAYF